MIQYYSHMVMQQIGNRIINELLIMDRTKCLNGPGLRRGFVEESAPLKFQGGYIKQ